MELILQQLAAKLKLVYQGDGDITISGAASLKSATAGDLCFIQHGKYLDNLARSNCSAVIVPPDLAGEVSGKALLISANPQYDFVRVIDLLAAGRQPASAGIHPSAQVAASARIGRDVSIGALTTIADDAEIGAGTSIGSGVSIASSVRIGKRCQIHGRVTLEQGVVLGDRCILHPGVVIGCDGFGQVMHRKRWHKIPQLGSVLIGDDVEIGANTTVDRGALDDTVIEQGCKLDNQIQIAHNVHIGAHTAIAACVGIAGSAVIGRYCKISGAAVVLGHLSVVDNVTITAMSLVTKDIRESGVYSSGTPLMENGLWHRSNARYKSLEKLAQSVARLEKANK
ncbi:MAG: UDP-3-O-(3-hydroxymyristoyl)glucosamine N-acyltransferase [Gammaproteobacteria bacterium]|nr:UDP-3-O-(3-hydroxymyristoyl)glucosamine N-acyltransferase [Gammaproteobacteria bacterium]MDH3535764.1 UDP-3-O-(3-hydroxymyristoyl)glucosamine N-acyltransferase [Gammaproteobacteria bacterium]